VPAQHGAGLKQTRDRLRFARSQGYKAADLIRIFEQIG